MNNTRYALLLMITLFNNQAFAQNANEPTWLSHPIFYFVAFDIGFVAALWVLLKLAGLLIAELENFGMQKRG